MLLKNLDDSLTNFWPRAIINEQDFFIALCYDHRS
jgi:hypothetical protein